MKHLGSQLHVMAESPPRLIHMRWLVHMQGAFWVGDIVSFYNLGVIHLIKLISDDMSAWEYRAGHEDGDLFSARGLYSS